MLIGPVAYRIVSVVVEVIRSGSEGPSGQKMPAPSPLKMLKKRPSLSLETRRTSSMEPERARGVEAS